MKQNGFTLIELLVVVAIIGILAAVGVVAYNGYTKSAKIAVIKSNHKNVLKFIATEMQKCETQGYVELNYNSSNPTKVYQVTCDSVGQTTRDMALSFNEHFKSIGFKNPLNKNKNGGIHHICYEVKNLELSINILMKNNYKIIGDNPKIGAHGKPVIFLHPSGFDGTLIELQEE